MNYKSLEIQISPTHKLFEICDEICYKSKNLYNLANYHIRQHLFTTAGYISQKELYYLISKTNAFYDLGHTNISNQIVRDVWDVWSSYKASIKSYKKDPSIWSGHPKLPKYKDKIKGRFQTCFTMAGSAPPVRINKAGRLGFMGKHKFQLIIPDYIKGKEIKEIVITPGTQHYSILINYIDCHIKQEFNPSNIAAIDLGINNLMTVTFNNKNQPILFKGGVVKSINQYYNKQLAKFNSQLPKNIFTSKRIKILTRKRNNKIKYELHCQSKILINLLHEYNIGTLVIGNNKGWKQDINLGKKTNQKFVNIPYNKLVNQIIYKYDGQTLIQEESYTSKSSFLDSDEIPIYSKKMETPTVFSGKRISRGLYQTKSGQIINADVNGSYNIMRKAFPNEFSNGIEAVVVQPVIFKVSA